MSPANERGAFRLEKCSHEKWMIGQFEGAHPEVVIERGEVERSAEFHWRGFEMFSEGRIESVTALVEFIRFE